MKTMFISLILLLIAYYFRALIFFSWTLVYMVGVINTVDLIKRYREKLKDNTFLPW